MPMPLTLSDFAKLEKESWNDRSIVELFGLYRVDSYEGAELVGQRANEDFAGIVFHGFWPGDQNPRVRMLRRDNPPMEKNKDRILKSIRKYIAESGRGNRISFGPGESPKILKDVQAQFWMTEGPKQLCVLWRLARHESKEPRAVACAINGVYGYRGTIGKVVNSNGKRVDEKGVISDFDRVHWTGREVVIIFDSDAATNEKVAAARRGLVAELTRRGARVVVVDLPTLDGRDKTGIDDFLAERGPEEALQLISNSIHAYKSAPPHESNFTPIAANQLLSEPPEEIDFVHDDYLALGGLGVLAGKPKEGKTTYAYELAVKVALGLPFLDRQTRKGAVLILALEEHAREVRMRLRNLGASEIPNIFLHIGPLEPTTNTLDGIRSFAHKQGVVLILIDTLSAFWQIDNENDAAEMTRAVKPLLQLARESGACVLLIHHARKSEGSYGDEIRGSGALFAACDVALILKRHNVQTQRLLQTQSRYPETPSELVIELRETGYTAIGDPASTGKAEKLAKLIASLKDEPEQSETIAKRAKLSLRDGYRLLGILLKEGKIVREGKGVKNSPFRFRNNSIHAGGQSKGVDTNTNSEPETPFDSCTPPSLCTNGNGVTTLPTPVAPGSNESELGEEIVDL